LPTLSGSALKPGPEDIEGESGSFGLHLHPVFFSGVLCNSDPPADEAGGGVKKPASPDIRPQNKGFAR